MVGSIRTGNGALSVMAETDSDIAKKIIRETDALKASRSTWENHWREVAERILPRDSRVFQTVPSNQTKGEKRSELVYDSTSAVALDRFSAVMESMLTPRNSIWHRLRASNEELDKIREVRLWFDEALKVLFRYRYSPTANFATQKHSDYISLGAYGNGLIFVDSAADEPGLRYKAVHLSGTYIQVNHQGLVDTVYREFSFTATQAAQKWGKDNIPDDMVKVLDKDPYKEFDFIHCVKPRMDLDPSRFDFKSMPWSSHYVARSKNTLMSEGGYTTFPYSVSRHINAPGEMYARGPAMMVLPAIKTLNEQKKTVLKQGHRIVDPVLLAHDDGVIDSVSLRNGAVNYGGVNKDGRALIQALPTGNLAVGFEMMNQEREVIQDAFLVTLFQILTENPQMTATEVLERTREKGMLLAPTMGRQQSETLGPLIDRELDILAQQNLLPLKPAVMIEAENEYEVQYDSPLSRAVRAEEAAGLFRSLEFAAAYASQTGDVSVYDHFDIDTITPELLAINGVPEKWRRAPDSINAVRDSRAQQADQAAAIEAAPGAAQLMKAGAGA